MIGKSDQPIKRVLLHITMIILGLLAVVPIYVMLINSVRSSEQINSGLTIIFERNSFRSMTNENVAVTQAKRDEHGIVRLVNFDNEDITYINEGGQRRLFYLPAGVEIEIIDTDDDDEEYLTERDHFPVNVTAPHIVIYNEITNEAVAEYYLDPGLYIDIVQNNDTVKSGSILFKRFLSVSDISGTVRFIDLEPGITVKEEIDKNTGITSTYVNEYLAVMNDTDRAYNNRVLNPRLSILDDEGNAIRTMALTSGLYLNVSNGEKIQPGTVLFDRVKRPPNLIYNWRALISRGFRIFRGFLNSAVIAIGSTLLVVYFSALTAYGLHVYRFKGRMAMWALILVIMMLPGSLTFIGFYQLMATWKLTDSYIPLILPGIAAAGAVLFIRQYMMSVLNMELIDAARIDGSGEFHTFNKIIIPLIVPVLAAQSIFAFVGSWNNFLAPFILISSQEKYTLPMFVFLLRGDIYRTETGGIYLGIAISLIPIIIFYGFMAKFIISGITMGGIKE